MKKPVEDIIKLLESEGVVVEKSPYCNTGLYIKGFDYISKLKAFNEGYISVQDISSMLVALVADPEKENYCIDICAAPGGKSLHLCELMCGNGMVEARDLTEKKISLIEENINRVGAKNIKTIQKDALVLDETSIGKADIVIADLPCSGLGVIGKKSDIKYNMTLEKQETLVKIQRDILKNAIQYVKSGGYLIFSTCTTNKLENEDNYNWLLEEFSVKSVDISKNIPEIIRKQETTKGYIQLLPGIDETDGFFISKVQVI